jgi:hypothetical protein
LSFIALVVDVNFMIKKILKRQNAPRFHMTNHIFNPLKDLVANQGHIFCDLFCELELLPDLSGDFVEV